MSNTAINWRFWAWHLQVLMWRYWPGSIRRGEWRSLIRISHNGYWSKGGRGRRADEWTPVALYDGKRYAVGLIALIAALIWWAL